MRPLKLCLTAVGLIATATARIAAQQFEGTMQFVTSQIHPGQADTITFITKGSKIRIEGVGKGIAAGGSVIIDGDNRIVLLPSHKMWMTAPANFGEKVAEQLSKANTLAVRTGKMETVAGITCEDWHYKGTRGDGTREEGDACLANGAGLMINKLFGGIAGNYINAGGQQFVEAMKRGGGIMKLTRNGSIAIVAVRAQRMSVSDAMFAPPPDYRKLPMNGIVNRLTPE